MCHYDTPYDSLNDKKTKKWEGTKMVAFNDSNEQSLTDRAMEKIYEEMEQIVGSILVLVQEQLRSQMEPEKGEVDETVTDRTMILDVTDEELNRLIWGIDSEFFGC